MFHDDNNSTMLYISLFVRAAMGSDFFPVCVSLFVQPAAICASVFDITFIPLSRLLSLCLSAFYNFLVLF